MTTRVVHVNSEEWAQAVTDGTAVYIGRAVPRKGFKASKWANPFKVEIDAVDYRPAQAHQDAIEKYFDYLMQQEELVAALPELQGKVLGCWCKAFKPYTESMPCHGNLLARLADMSEADIEQWLR